MNINQWRSQPRLSPISTRSSVSRPNFGAQNGGYANRQYRQQMRAAKRWGDWSVHEEVAWPLLWLDAGCVPDPFGVCQPLAQPVMELWP